MKKFILFITVLIVLTSCNNADTSKKIKVGLDDTFAPMGFKEDGKIIGFDIDLANAVSKEIGIEFEFTPIDWNSVVLELDSKNIDLIWNGLTITEERKNKMAMSKPYFEAAQAIYVKEDSKIKFSKDLENKLVGLQLGSTAEDSFKKQEVSSKVQDVVKYQDNIQAFLDLKVGRIDAVIVGSTFGDYYTNQNSGFTKLDQVFAVQGVGIGARFEDQKLIDDIDGAILILKENGEYQKIYDKWFKNKSE